MQWLIAGAVIVAGGLASVVMSWVRRRRPAAPTQPRLDVPAQLDRADFPAVTTPWMVVVFSSASCTACAAVVRKAEVLNTREVTVVEVEYTANRSLHQKYSIEAVPLVAIADAHGVVHRGFAGPMSATDLWAAVADAREPGTSPEPGLGADPN